MLRKLATIAVLAAIAGGLAFYVLTMPRTLPEATLAALPEGDAARGETMFWAGGCASCHAADKAEGDDRLKLGGGHVLKSGFGDFVAPNISPDRNDGIGAWSRGDFANAMLRGVSPAGAHLYPAFPYTSYTRMKPRDVADLWAFLKTLPAVEGRAPGHRLGFPFTVRRGLGLWKLLYLDPAPVIDLQTDDPQLLRGQYLVEGPGHCGECHTPRDVAGGLIQAKWLSGAPNPDGEGRVPNITGGKGGIGDWSQADIAYYLESGFTPAFDSVGGSMVEVQENMAKLTAEDRDAIAAYLKAVPAVDATGQ
ncbi:cytochrome c [Oricola nitratireducens]|uniref:cytochrome c n=1 Tax=Oricola nitratireducens TaxID=2775868 RepID=UPI0018690D60|nr:cytochrome c [Oricola nitratireducens]